MRTRWLSRASVGAAALLLLPALSGCVAVATVNHVRGAGEAAAHLASELQSLEGVHRATSRYDAADLAGESLRVDVALTSDATPDEWTAAVELLHERLTAGALASVRPEVRLHSSGRDGATVEVAGSGSPWTDISGLRRRLDGWKALRELAGVPMRFEQTSANGGTTWYRIDDEAAARRFIARLPRLASALEDASVVGPGFSGNGPAPNGTGRLYRLALRDHAAGRPWATVAALGSVASVTWSPRTVQVMTWTGAKGASWSAADLALASAVTARPARGAQTMFSWQSPSRSAVISVRACRKGALTAQADDERLAGALAAVGSPVPRPGGAGACAG